MSKRYSQSEAAATEEFLTFSSDKGAVVVSTRSRRRTGAGEREHLFPGKADVHVGPYRAEQRICVTSPRSARKLPGYLQRIFLPKQRRTDMRYLSFVGTGLITVGALTGGALAGPSKTDMDFCNQKAAQASKPSSVQPGTSAQPGTPPATTGSDRGGLAAPGTAVRPAPG